VCDLHLSFAWSLLLPKDGHAPRPALLYRPRESACLSLPLSFPRDGLLVPLWPSLALGISQSTRLFTGSMYNNKHTHTHTRWYGRGQISATAGVVFLALVDAFASSVWF